MYKRQDRSRRADSHQGVHIGRAAKQRFKADLKIAAVEIRHRQSQKQLCKSKGQGIFRAVKKMGDWQPHHVPMWKKAWQKRKASNR